MNADTERWQMAQSIEAEHHSHERKVQEYERVLARYGISRDDLVGKNVLALGAGTGIVHGIDVDCTNVAIDPLTFTFRDVLADSSAELVTGIGEKLPFDDDTLDLIISRNVLDHTIDPRTVFEEIRRLLKPDGTFVLDVNVFLLPRAIRERLSLIDHPHPHHFSPDEVINYLESSGFDLSYVELERIAPRWREFRIKRITATTIFRIRKLYAKAE